MSAHFSYLLIMMTSSVIIDPFLFVDLCAKECNALQKIFVSLLTQMTAIFSSFVDLFPRRWDNRYSELLPMSICEFSSFLALIPPPRRVFFAIQFFWSVFDFDRTVEK